MSSSQASTSTRLSSLITSGTHSLPHNSLTILCYLTKSHRYLDHTGLAKPYFEQNWMPPRYIGRDGEADTDNIDYSVEKLNARTGELAKDEKFQTAPTAQFDPDKLADPTDFASKPTNPDLKTVELPLISDVWNGMEPINYVSWGRILMIRCELRERVYSIAKLASAIRRKDSILILIREVPYFGFSQGSTRQTQKC